MIIEYNGKRYDAEGKDLMFVCKNGEEFDEDDVTVILDELPEGATVELDNIEAGDDYGHTLVLDLKTYLEVGYVEIFSAVAIGRGYHYSGRNSLGEWVEPEESGFNIERLTCDDAYYYSDEIGEARCELSSACIDEIREMIQDDFRS